jgi:hypothetical protein
MDQTDSFSNFVTVPDDPIRFGLRICCVMVEIYSGQLSDVQPRMQVYTARGKGMLVP